MSRWTVGILRHGQYEQPAGVPSAHLPHPLLPEGENAAREAAQKIWAFAEQESLELDVTIDCSSLLRAWQTASIIAGELQEKSPRGFQVAEFPDLAERSVGAAANLTRDQIEAVLDRDPRFGSPSAGWKRNPSYRLPLLGAESLLEAGERVAAHWRRREDQGRVSEKPQLKILVGHGGSLRHAALKLGILDRDDVARLSMWHCHPIFFRRDADGNWERRDGNWKVRDPESAGPGD